MTPVPSGASCANTSRFRSMMWPVYAFGPRSPTRHCAVRPFAVLWIVTIVPKGRVRWAHEPEPAWLSYQLAEPDCLAVLLAGAGTVGGRCEPDVFVPRRRIWLTGAWTTSSRTTFHCTIWPSLRTTFEKTCAVPLRPACTVAVWPAARVASFRYSV